VSDTLVGWRTWASMPGHVRVVAYVKKNRYGGLLCCVSIFVGRCESQSAMREVGGGLPVEMG